jgi:5-methylcytosine-specific restriction protein A
MPKRPCLDCGALHSNSSRCASCEARYKAKVEQSRGSATRRGYGYGWRGLARQLVTEHVASYGSVCPGHSVPAHPSTDLTVDHIIPKSQGGSNERSNLMVLCRGCNARKRNTQAR